MIFSNIEKAIISQSLEVAIKKHNPKKITNIWDNKKEEKMAYAIYKTMISLNKKLKKEWFNEV